MSKEKRIAAKAEKERIATEKRVLEVKKILEKGKDPVSQSLPASEKTPAEAKLKQGGIFQRFVEVSSDKEDRKESWSWGIPRDWHPIPGNTHIEDFIGQYHQKKLWREVFEEKTVGKGESIKQKHVKYNVSDICPEAQKRLIEIKLDDFEEIFRFRMTNLERLYGLLLDNGAFLTVWYDPNHKIYPTD